MKKRLITGLVPASFLLYGGLSAMAAMQTTTMNVTGTVPVALTVSATDLNFGTLSFSSSTTATATITVNAAPGINYQIAIDAGSNSWSSKRYMADAVLGTALIWYELYTDSAHTTVWGDSCLSSPTYPSGSCVSGTGDGTDQTYTVYGKIDPITYDVGPGTFTDTLTVTVSY